MTKLLEQALEAVRQMPPANQDEVARVMFNLARMGELDDVDPEHWQEALTAKAAVRRGDVASPEEVADAFASFER